MIGEPVTWSPPLSVVSDLELPGPDPTAVSIVDLHQAVADQAAPMSRVAREFGVSTAMVCYLLECSPLDRPVDRKQTQLVYAASQLTKSEFVRLYQHDRLSITAMAARIGVGHASHVCSGPKVCDRGTQKAKSETSHRPVTGYTESCSRFPRQLRGYLKHRKPVSGCLTLEPARR